MKLTRLQCLIQYMIFTKHIFELHGNNYFHQKNKIFQVSYRLADLNVLESECQSYLHGGNGKMLHI